MRLSTSVWVGMLALLGSCGQDASLIRDAHATISKTLYDPDSAKFDGDVLVGGGKGVCGFVNAKNRMGGYVGRTPYYFTADHGSAMVSQSPSLLDLHMLDAASTDDSASWDRRWGEINSGCRVIRLLKSECPAEMAATIEQDPSVCVEWDKSKGDVTATLKALGESSR